MKTVKHVDMSNISIGNIIIYTLPLIATSFLQQLFNSADSAVVGQFVSSQALAAVGGNGPVVNLIIALFNGLAIGVNVIIARFLGEGNKEKVSQAVPSFYLLAIVTGLFVGALGLFIARPILKLIATPADIIDLATTYLRIYFVGMPVFMIYNFGAAILRSNGETKKPLIALLISGVINVGLNVFFVVVLNLSVVGVGLATVISNAVSAAVVTYLLVHRDDCLKLTFKNFKLCLTSVTNALRIGFPAGFQGTVFGISNTVILSAINSFGSAAAAGATAAQAYETFSYYVTFGFATGIVSFISHNYGAKDIAKCKKLFKNCLFITIVAQIIFDAILFIFRYPLLHIFTPDNTVVDFAVIKLSLVACLHCMITSYEIPAGCLRGYGKSFIPSFLTLIGCCGVRLFWVFFILPLHRTFPFLFLTYPISWVFCGTMVMTAYFLELKKIEATI